MQLDESIDRKHKDMKGWLYIHWKNLYISGPVLFKPFLFKDQLYFISAVGKESYSNK